MKKLEEKNVIEYFKNNGGYNVMSPYKSLCENLLIEKDGYKFYMSFAHFREGNSPNLFGKRCEFQIENMNLFVSKIDKNVKVLSAREIKVGGKSRILVKLQCSCGNIFERNWNHIYGEYKIYCNDCSISKMRKDLKNRYHNKYYKDIKKRGYELVNKKEILYANKPVEVIQVKTGYRGFIYPNNNKGMIVFSLFTNRKNLLYNLNVSSKNDGEFSEVLELVDEVKNNNQEIIVKCECGEIFNTKYRSYLNGKTRCDKCSASISRYEREVQLFLEEKNIKYIYQFQINSCKDIRPLPFDFQLCDYNILLEIDGEQHFEPITFGGISKEIAEKRFNSCQKRDNIKTEYCKKYNIPFLRISYKDILENSYKEKILHFIQTIQNK